MGHRVILKGSVITKYLAIMEKETAIKKMAKDFDLPVETVRERVSLVAGEEAE